MKRIKQTDFTFTLQHDGGKVRITIRSHRKLDAKRILLASESCPERAIVEVKSRKV